MDFFANPSVHDPYVFIQEARLGGNWLRVKAFMSDLTTFEETLIDSPAEKLLQHLEKELNPVKSYKMVVLKSLLALGGAEWKVTDIATLFLNYYLENRIRLADWDELARAEDPTQYSLNHVVRHLIAMPLDRMADSVEGFFELDKPLKIFRLRKDLHSWWMGLEFRKLIADRADFALARYFYHKDKASSLVENSRGFAVEIPYATRTGSGYSELIRKVIASEPNSNIWEFDFQTKGYSGNMNLEIYKEQKFVAWTHTRYDDISRFPARIKAAATALFNERQLGEFNIAARDTRIIIKRV